MNIFKLPDLGEGLIEAEIVEWHVQPGDEIKTDALLVAVETAKAIVDIPSPTTGVVQKLYGEPGDVVQVGDPLVEFNGADKTSSEVKQDSGTVVGKMESTDELVKEPAATVKNAAAGFKATPAVRALAHRDNVDLSVVTPSGPDDTITAGDVQRVAKILQEVGIQEPLRGVRRSMARTMAQAHAEVAHVTLCDDADIHLWSAGADTTVRLIHSIVTACEQEPSLNCWFDSQAMGRRLIKKVDLGLAMDTAEGLFVPVLRDVQHQSSGSLREQINQLKLKVQQRTIPPEDLRGYTFTLSNFGRFAGRYADPVVVPPTVAILGAGRIREAVVMESDGPVAHRMLPLSLSFDHRAVNGGEAARFLAVVIESLQAPE